MRERFRSRIFLVGTAIILAVVAAAIVIPTLNSGKTTPERVGVVGNLSAGARSAVESSATSNATTVHFRTVATSTQAATDLRAGLLDLVVIDGRTLEVNTAISPSDSSTNASFIQAVAQNLSYVVAFQDAHLTAAQVHTLEISKALPVASLQPAKPSRASHVNSVALTGVILIFVMLSQYNTWILIGVMEEKSSRVIEVLLSALRPIQLLSGKVAGIGLVAFAQATLIVVFALSLSKGVGSNLFHGTAPLVLASTIVWLVVGYAFYCWVYAAAGSMAERQDQVQTLAFPLSLPMIFGYIVALTGASSGAPSELVKVLAYLPPTAPFAMPVLVGFSAVTWWEFAASVVFSLVCTIGVAQLAARIYRRAILRTGRRVKIREVVSRRVA